MVHSQRSAVVKRTEYIQPKVISNAFMCFVCASLGPPHNVPELQLSSPLHCVLSASSSQVLAFKVPEGGHGLSLGRTYIQSLFPPSPSSFTKALAVARMVILGVARYSNGIRAAWKLYLGPHWGTSFFLHLLLQWCEIQRHSVVLQGLEDSSCSHPSHGCLWLYVYITTVGVSRNLPEFTPTFITLFRIRRHNNFKTSL